jgi:hypothetical protein
MTRSVNHFLMAIAATVLVCATSCGKSDDHSEGPAERLAPLWDVLSIKPWEQPVRSWRRRARLSEKQVQKLRNRYPRPSIR